MFLTSTALNESYLSTSKSPEIKINQILFRKVNLGMFGPCAFNTTYERRCVLISTVWSCKFDSWFSFPEECKGLPLMYILDIT